MEDFILKGQSDDIFRVMFWSCLEGLGQEKNRYFFLNFRDFFNLMLKFNSLKRLSQKSLL